MSRTGALLITSALIGLASPALATELRLKEAAPQSYQTTLQAASRAPATRTLDWRTPSIELRFDLSDADIIERLALTLSADPLPGVDPSLPLVVQFNNGKPININTKGRGFDATVALDAKRARARGNVLRLSYAVDCGHQSGGYGLSLDESQLKIVARAKSRKMQLREVESRLSASAFAPARVGLLASGSDATTLKALGAQALGIRLAEIPDFRQTSTSTDFDLIMAKRSELYKFGVSVEGQGPRIEITRDRKPQLVLTGDTDREVLSSVKAFATAYLPMSRRSITSPGEILIQSPLDFTRTTVEGTEPLAALSVTTGLMREYRFDVSDPAAADGHLRLRLTRDQQTAPGAKMKVVLNGQSLGEVKMDSRRKTVAFPIRAEQLKGGDNQLTLTTKPSTDAADSCAASAPFIAVGAGSKLHLTADRPSPASDLSRLAANGSVFSYGNGSNTAVQLPRTDNDFNAAMGVMARLAKASGRGWTNAEYTRGDTLPEGRHIVSLRPITQINPVLADKAPRALKSAWRGQPTTGENRLAAIERFAALDGEEAVRLAARRLRASGDVGAGGVAAVFAVEQGRLAAVISNTPGTRFASAVAPLETAAHWNGLTGGVSRWNDRAIVMAQTASPALGLSIPTPKNQTPAWLEDLGLPNIDLPSLDIPEVEWPDFAGMVESAKDRWSTMTEGKPTPETLPQEASTGVNYAAKTPAMRPLSGSAPAIVAPAVSASAIATPPAIAAPKVAAPKATPRLQPTIETARPKLRGPIDLKAAQPTSDRWAKTKRWFGSSWTEKRSSARRALRRTETRLSQTRADLRQKLGIRKPRLSEFETGAQPWFNVGSLALVLMFLLTLFGLALISPSARTGDHH